MTLEALLRDGFAYHDPQSERFAAELEGAAGSRVADADCVRLLHVSNHTIGEHLSDWPRARALAEHVLEGRKPSAASAAAWARLAAARFLAGDPVGATSAEAACIGACEDRVAAWVDCKVTLAGAMIGSGRLGDAVAVFDAALVLARVDGPSVADRSVAVTANNLALELLETPDRSPAMDASMRRAAQAALMFWRKAGTWINAARGQHLIALVENALGDPRAALAAAGEGLASIAANDPSPLDEIGLRLARADAFARLADADAHGQALAEADAMAAVLADDPARPKFKAWYADQRAGVRLI